VEREYEVLDRDWSRKAAFLLFRVTEDDPNEVQTVSGDNRKYDVN
jgi:hypothetical protein